ncbi:MAG: hypothetical protein KBT36_05395 [Kurthia sp.]|nr:hypothetical protein [Candidatus Kurthia equi]
MLHYITEHGTFFYEAAAFFKIAAASTIQNWKNISMHKEKMPFSQL